MTAGVERARRAGALLALGLAACGAPAPDLDAHMATLAACPADDRAWLAAVKQAETEGRLEALRARAAELDGACGDWAPVWTEARCLLGLDRPHEARERFEAALARASAAGVPVGVARSSDQLGWIAYTLGELQRGRELYERAIAAAIEAQRLDLECFARNNHAGLLVDLGEFDRARDEIEAAAAGLRELGLRDAARGLEYNRAILLLELGDALTAQRSLEALHEAAAAEADAWSRDATALVLGNLHLCLEEHARARAWLERVSAEFPDLAQLARVGIGRVALREGDALAAIGALEPAVDAADEAGRLHAAAAAAALAEAELDAGRIEAARARIERLVEGGIDDLAADASWVAHWLHGRTLAAAGETGRAIAAFEAAIALLDGQSAPLDPLGEGLYFLRQRSEPYAALAVAEARRGGPGSDERVLATIRKAKARALRHALRTEDAAPAADRSLESIRRGLAPGELLLDYLLGRDAGVVLAISPREVRATTLATRSTLLEPLAAYRSALASPATGGPLDDRALAAGRRLYAELLAPVGDLVAAAERIYVVPDRELATIPFAALPVPGPHAGAEPSFLGLRVETAVLPLATIPAKLDLAAGPALLAGQPILPAGGEFAELPWAAFELSRLRERWGDRATLVTAADFSREAFLRLPLRDYRVLHLATHGVASTRDPRRCGVVLSHGERLGIDDLLDLQLDSNLVVLSSCRSGEGELLPGEGVIGLGWALLRAGAAGLVVSLWAVDDASSARLMDELHGGIRGGADPVTALAAARRTVARDDPHPRAWAPFVVVLR